MPPAELGWQHLSDAERAREYAPSSCIGGDYRPFIDAYAQRSAAARERAVSLGGRWQRLRHGSLPAQGIELCRPPAASGAGPHPLLLFVHGGYWQELSAGASLFAAARCIERGIAFAAVDYTLAPQATVARIVDECRAAYAVLAAQAPALGLDARRIVVAGSSAGAHLAAMVALPDALPEDIAPPYAAVLVSGVYALEPLVGTPVNDALGLQADEARALSPLLLPLAGFPRSVLCWGEVETASFKSQSRAFDAALRRSGSPTRSFEVPRRNHFDVILDLTEPGTPLGDATLDLLGAST